MPDNRYQAPRGTQDILPADQPYWDAVRNAIAARMPPASATGASIPRSSRTPALFTRTVGDVTDIVQKEMYVFEDRGEQELALRPEGTAPICRAYLEHGMHNQPQPVRLFYIAPNFRYDRPQAGRYRQHHQFGAEAIGEADAVGGRRDHRAALAALRGARPDRPDAEPELDRRPDLPPALPRGAPRLLRGQARPRLRRLSRPLRAQPAAAPRLQERTLPAGDRRGADDDRPPLRRLRRALRRPALLPRRRGHPVRAEADAGSRPRLLHAHRVRGASRRRRAARAASAAAAATTA